MKKEREGESEKGGETEQKLVREREECKCSSRGMGRGSTVRRVASATPTNFHKPEAGAGGGG